MRPIGRTITPTLLSGAAALWLAAAGSAATVSIEGDPAQGDAAAPLVLVEFADYQ